MKIDTAELTDFLRSDDAPSWLAAINTLKGPLREVVLQHAKAMGPHASHKQRLLTGPLLSESVEGRIVERRHREELPYNIAQAEGVPLSKVYRVLGMNTAANNAELREAGVTPPAATAKKPGRVKTKERDIGDVPVDERPALIADVLAKHAAGTKVAKIAKGTGLKATAIYKLVSIARRDGTYPTVGAPAPAAPAEPSAPEPSAAPGKRGGTSKNARARAADPGKDLVSFPPEERETIRADVIQRRLRGERNLHIAAAVGLKRSAVDNVVYAAKKEGTVFPELPKGLNGHGA